MGKFKEKIKEPLISTTGNDATPHYHGITYGDDIVYSGTPSITISPPSRYPVPVGIQTTRISGVNVSDEDIYKYTLYKLCFEDAITKVESKKFLRLLESDDDIIVEMAKSQITMLLLNVTKEDDDENEQ